MTRPQVTLAWAQSLDGALTATPGTPTALSGPPALAYTHHLRAHHAAILVGVNTVLSDNPHLTVRHAPGPHPQPVVLDSTLRTPPTAALLNHPTHQVWVATTPHASAVRRHALEQAGAHLITVPATATGQVSLPAVLAVLAERGVASLMVEGGPTVLAAFLHADLWDTVSVTLTPHLLGGSARLHLPAPCPLPPAQVTRYAADVVLEINRR